MTNIVTKVQDDKEEQKIVSWFLIDLEKWIQLVMFCPS